MIIFPLRKMQKNQQTSESAMLSRFQVGAVLLPPLIVKSCTVVGGTKGKADAFVELVLPGESEGFRFAVEVKARATPQSVQLAMAEARVAAAEGEWPMIYVPFLSSERLAELEREEVSGVDLCGNGVVVVPGRLYVWRSGAPNQYRDSRPLSNPYRGRSGMVARMLLQRPRWESLSELTAAVQASGVELSLPQASKAVQALDEDLMVSKSAGAIILREPLRLLDKLGSEWRTLRQIGRRDAGGGGSAKIPSGSPMSLRPSLRLPAGTDWARALSSDPSLQWAVSGESSATRYAMFSQGGPRRLAVSSVSRAIPLLGGTLEPVPNFADVELMETEEPGFFFSNETDENGIRWASRLQTWLELQSGDARQQDAAKDLRELIIKETER